MLYLLKNVHLFIEESDLSPPPKKKKGKRNLRAGHYDLHKASRILWVFLIKMEEHSFLGGACSEDVIAGSRSGPNGFLFNFLRYAYLCYEEWGGLGASI